MSQSPTIAIKISERPATVPKGTTLHALRAEHKPGADVVVLNGAPMPEDCILQEGDEVVFIRRGEIPGREELEALMASRHTPGVHAVIKRAVVGIAGVGGLGSAIAIALARIGIGKLIVADFDVVEPSNLNRQQYFIDQLGQPKVAALLENLSRINPYVEVETHHVRLDRENIPKIFGAVDVMVEAFDRADQKALLVEAFCRAFPAKSIVVATGLAGHMPSNTITTRKVGKQMVVVGDLVTAAQPGTGLMAPRVGVAAHHQANAVLRLLLGEDPEGC
ncbi:MAG: sulfur carrier protein ThiS adenylyltransferase ThiF [Candidatus Hydrogenedentes bacterium]|nr:sulfur carrier protein ThiS adenylyltransferase ThiF [Candidatus Hydrogenedentota bacterium]